MSSQEVAAIVAEFNTAPTVNQLNAMIWQISNPDFDAADRVYLATAYDQRRQQLENHTADTP